MSRFSGPTRRPVVAAVVTVVVVTVALTTTLAAVLATGASASARRTAAGRAATGRTAAAGGTAAGRTATGWRAAPGRAASGGTATKSPAKVKAGSVWIVEASGPRCQSDSFGAHHGFTAVGGAGADAGTYKGAKKLTMTWKTGMDAGDVFTGTWSKTTGQYTGTDTHAGQAGPATLVPVADGACAAVTTAPVSLSVPLGSTDTDVAAVRGTGGLSPTGTVHFYVCPGVTGSCTPTAAGAVDLGSSTLAGTGGEATASSAPYLAPAAGGYCFVGVYSGDSHYLSASDGSTTDECFNVGTATAAVTTRPTSATIILGGSDSDVATVTGGGITPTGTVHFFVCPPSTSPAPCTTAAAANGGADLGSSALSGAAGTATATSAAYTPPTLGTYCFLGVYSGDSGFLSGSDGSTTDECFTVTTNTPTVTTKPASLYVPQGSPVTDGATVTGAGAVTPTGTVTFYVCGPDPSGPVACTVAAGTPLGSPVTVAGSGTTATATSPAFTTSTLGTYCFLGVYSGDAHYTSASDGSTTDECFSVDPNHP